MILSNISATGGIDPNSAASKDASKLGDDLNRFLSLLITQLQNQDPLNPMDSTEFTSQLVQFASVEQQIKTNANMEKLLNLQQGSQVADLVGFIGTTIEATGDKVPLENGKAQFTYDLPANTKSTTISIRNAAGLTVYTGDGDTSSGRHTFTWDGKSVGGFQNPDGAYTAIVIALDAQNKLVTAKQTVFGRVTGAGVDGGNISLFLGDVTTSMDKVLAVKETDPNTP